MNETYATTRFNYHGLHQLSINIVAVQDVTDNIYLTPEAPMFRAMAKALDLGIRILETPDGRQALCDVGRAIVLGWKEEGRHIFEGDADFMSIYVGHFLKRIRDFPLVNLSNLMPCDTYAQTNRISLWSDLTGGVCSLHDYEPKNSVYLNFNHHKTVGLAQAYIDHDVAGFTTGLFKLGITTAHELVHVFGGYLARGCTDIGSYTPMSVRFRQIFNHSDQRGESGRWFENRLFGGAVAYLDDPSNPDDQYGREYLFCGGKFYRIHPDAVKDVVLNLKSATLPFPFRTVGSGIAPGQLSEMGLRQV